MASNGLLNTAKKGKCRLCLRVRDTKRYLIIVGEVRHGYATGNIWQCKNRTECLNAANRKIKINHKDARLCEHNINVF
jgi:hypothetical protein